VRDLRKPVNNAAQLRALLVSDAAWWTRVSAPYAEPLASADAAMRAAHRVGTAVLLRGAHARLLHVGRIEALLCEASGANPINTVHMALQRNRKSSTVNEAIKDDEKGHVHLGRWLEAPELHVDRKSGQLLKLLHVRAEQDAFPQLGAIAQVPPALAVTNWVQAHRKAYLQLVLSMQVDRHAHRPAPPHDVPPSAPSHSCSTLLLHCSTAPVRSALHTRTAHADGLCGPLWAFVDLCGPLWTFVDLCGRATPPLAALASQDTQYHRDNNGTDTWMKLCDGVVLVACWSYAE
jgi:hypothetical protein